MLVKRFGLAKVTENTISTPALWRVDDDIKFEDGYFIFPGGKIEKKIFFPPEIGEMEIKLNNDIYLIPNIPTMLKDTKSLVRHTFELRDKLGYDKLFYAPGTPPHLFPIMVYLGYDIFDNSQEKLGNYSLVGKVEESSSEFSEFMIRQVKIALQEGKLRELVESIADNKSKEILRLLDMKYYNKVEMFWPIWNRSLDAVTLDSLHRPDIKRWIFRLKERYEKPKWAKHLLLIPCSAKKPYSESKSHRLMREYIKSTMHEIILTSPLGLVPRELERFYPAQNYDIPVIGHWYEEEKKLITELLQWYLEKFQYESIVAYLPENMKFLESLLKEYDATMIWGRDLESLKNITRDIGYHVSWKKVLLENFRILAKFQFGCCDELFNNATIKGRFPRINIWRDNDRIFSYNQEKGMLTLAATSAECLAKNKKYTVYIDDFYPEGDVFAIGVIDATPEIREGDEVAIVHDGEMRGWGTAKMCSYDMIYQRRGKAVKVRGKIKI